MAVTDTVEKSTLAIRIRNGQTASGDWKYKNINISGVKDDIDVSNSTVLTKMGNIYNAIVGVLVGTADGMRVVKTHGLAVTA